MEGGVLVRKGWIVISNRGLEGWFWLPCCVEFMLVVRVLR